MRSGKVVYEIYQAKSHSLSIRNGEVISQLRHEHKMSVLSTKCEEATFLAGSELAVIR